MHDPYRQISFLRQALESAKRPLGLFLGAGCPLAVRVGEPPAPLIPDIAGMTDILRERFPCDCYYVNGFDYQARSRMRVQTLSSV